MTCWTSWKAWPRRRSRDKEREEEVGEPPRHGAGHCPGRAELLAAAGDGGQGHDLRPEGIDFLQREHRPVPPVHRRAHLQHAAQVRGAKGELRRRQRIQPRCFPFPRNGRSRSPRAFPRDRRRRRAASSTPPCSPRTSSSCARASAATTRTTRCCETRTPNLVRFPHRPGQGDAADAAETGLTLLGIPFLEAM